MGIEFELKYAATPAKQAALTRLLGEPAATYAMETTYFDTPAAALSARHYTLRRRMENGISVCTIKTPADHGARGEWECEAADIEAAIPKLYKLGGPAELLALTAEGIVPVCGARFTRHAYTVPLENCTVEVALDEGVLLGGGREVPLCEVEVELKSGSREEAILYAKTLAAHCGLVQQPKSKFRRALALARGE